MNAAAQKHPAADAEFIQSQAFGGGWIIPRSDEGYFRLQDYFGEAAIDLPPVGGESGYIVEPYEVDTLLQTLEIEGWAVHNGAA